MKFLEIAQQLWDEDDGFIVSAELLLYTTLLVVAVLVGLATVRYAVAVVFLDSAEALANRETAFEFDDSDPDFYFKRPTTGFFDENPDVGTEAGTLVPLNDYPSEGGN